MGMDWHSSGITTSVVGASKRGLNPRAHVGQHQGTIMNLVDAQAAAAQNAMPGMVREGAARDIARSSEIDGSAAP
jgi:hypothetical protein